YERKQQHEKAIDDLNEALEINPRYAEAFEARARNYLRLQRVDLALRDADRAVSLKPIEVGFMLTRARIFEAVGRNADALADYRRVLDIKPSTPAAIDGLRRLGVSPSSALALPR